MGDTVGGRVQGGQQETGRQAAADSCAYHPANMDGPHQHTEPRTKHSTHLLQTPLPARLPPPAPAA